MKMRVLGCAGGIGGREKLTTCLMVDQDILLDAGTGVTSLDMEAMSQIRHIFITHSHLDHVAGLALLIDAVQINRTGTVTVYATQKVIDALKKHLFNWVLWPDFTTIPNAQSPAMRWQAIDYGDTIELDGRLITPWAVKHTVGSAAYWVRNVRAGFLFTGDMGSTPELWENVAREKLLKQVIVDCSFSNADYALAETSLHFCPDMLCQEIRALPDDIEFLIYHLKPGQEELIMRELDTEGSRAFRAIRCGDVFEY
ncbi:beta-lactamase family protein [Paucimonas lemoignei]|uniref:Beta-lactamase family protein n=1 Tax=Paucimonas lemoignei TaxID=29443 RepID=A0A4V2UJ94_PAULE|nr:3',5'-cyclic-nucleotide phosphodiesterase [Paucimonas lemoignei]TCS39130.1 beta-lactamase family protein [Paucimonas lemoignei]